MGTIKEQLPRKVDHIVFCPLAPIQMRAYRRAAPFSRPALKRQQCYQSNGSGIQTGQSASGLAATVRSVTAWSKEPLISGGNTDSTGPPALSARLVRHAVGQPSCGSQDHRPSLHRAAALQFVLGLWGLGAFGSGRASLLLALHSHCSAHACAHEAALRAGRRKQECAGRHERERAPGRGWVKV